MVLTILTDNPKSWIIPYVNILKKELKNHKINHVFTHDQIEQGDIVFIRKT